MLKHVDLKVTGKVQGVWFRKSAQIKAVELGIKGFVKNVPDGSVYIEAEGNDEQLKHFIEWCKSGPEFALVQGVIFKETTLKTFDSFDIIY